MTSCFKRSVSVRSWERKALLSAPAPVDCTAGSEDLRALEKVLRMGLRTSSGVAWEESVEALRARGARREGCVMRMSVMIWRAMA